ncbi:methyltransferase domain-containing protein [Desulfovibrio sp. UIB00]|uniref:tRNA1(Val) (adenine(37)-N6)-methyltransferase n=1 Tax=Desulfovibrio sp. UIB00 TaxID=2804314 RepID=UPI001F0D007C|nr:methyltransferase domain-containing protein [Desulfovibrio sp. UIB00]MCH5143543.1 methyltransferase domain-containing protein [Desulfovibrio sp. UIB00]
MHTDEPFYSARQLFPRGLEQPEGSLRFGADALLLSAFVARHVESLNAPRQAHLTAAELGCGCGAALLGLALRCPGITGLGLDREAPLVQAATVNAARLGLTDRLRFAEADLADRKLLSELAGTTGVSHAGKFDLVLANPPYGVAGRPSPRHMRERALRGAPGEENREYVLQLFCRAAAALLRHQGCFCCIYDAPALPQLCAGLNDAGLGLRLLLPVRTHRAKPALRILALARKNTAHETVIETPLTLHTGASTNDNSGTSKVTGGGKRGPRWSTQALRFCPWLA